MRLPRPASSYLQRVSFGRYLVRRLRRAKLTTLSADAEAATLAVKTMGRAWEDASEPLQDALADRDGADDDLDVSAQEGRVKLAGRSVDASTTAPYTLIYPQGIGYYIAAPLDQEVKRYGELSARLQEHLPADDAVRTAGVAAIAAGLDAFAAGVAALDKARTDESLAHTRLLAATEAWERQMEKTYGALTADLGRAAADRFFPKARAKKKQGDAGPNEGGGG